MPARGVPQEGGRVQGLESVFRVGNFLDVFKDIWQISIACFLIGIVFISLILKILSNGSVFFCSAPVFSKYVNTFELPNLEIDKK